jgi:hypothetical protein
VKFRGWLELETPEAWPCGLLTHATAEPVTGEIDGNAFGVLTFAIGTACAGASVTSEQMAAVSCKERAAIAILPAGPGEVRH